jgi:hypothetical protein
VKKRLTIAMVLSLCAPMAWSPVEAMSLPSVELSGQTDPLVQKVARVVRRGVAVGPRGGVGYRRSAVVRPGFRGGGVYRGGGARWGGWARPGWYRWGPGGAIAAGAAIGFVTAAAAVAWAGAAPGPGLCWYYTDPSRTQGFWDACP